MTLRKYGTALFCALTITLFLGIYVSSAQDDGGGPAADGEASLEDLLGFDEGQDETAEGEDEDDQGGDTDPLSGDSEEDEKGDVAEDVEAGDNGEQEIDLGGLFEEDGDQGATDEAAETQPAEAEDTDDNEEDDLSDLLGGLDETDEGTVDTEAGEDTEVEEEADAGDEDMSLEALLGETEEEPEEAAAPEEAAQDETAGETPDAAATETADERMEETARMVDEAAASIEEEILQEAEQEDETPVNQEAQAQVTVQAVEPVPAAEEVSRAEPALSPELSNVMTEEELRRVALEQYARETMLEGEAALERNNFEKAVRLFSAALDKRIPRRPETDWVRKRARDGLRNSYYQEALLLREQREYEKARARAQKAANLGHEKAARFVSTLKRLIEEEPQKIDVSRPADYIDSRDFRQKEADVQKSLRVGKRYLAAGEYDKAQYEFEKILRDHPDNTESIRLLAKVAREREDRAVMERETTRDSMIASLVETWNPRDYAEVSPAGVQDGETTTRPEPEMRVSARTRLIEKMQNIEIPEITFRQANIYDVVDFLTDASIEFDKSDDDRKGVNIILQLGAGRGPEREAAPAPAGGGGLWGAAGDTAVEPEGAGEDVELITFSARYISLWRALKLVADAADLRVEVEESIVKLVPSDKPRGDIIVRWYSVLPSAQQKIARIKGELAGGGSRTAAGGMGGFGGFGGGAAAQPEEEGGWKDGFREMGVDWPEGSSIKYVGSIGKLIVANTADNLAVLEQILSVINVVPYQIEIEARFVEVRRGDLSSLGFEWLLTDDWEVATDPGSGSSVLPSSQERIVVRANDQAPIGSGRGFTQANRFVREGLNNASVSDSLLTVAGVLTNPELEFILHAMEQRGFADMLSAPKVTTQAGHDAEIKVVTEYIYPTDFTVTPVTAGDDDVDVIIGGIVEPSAFETREVGVILGVVPEVSDDGQMIDLTMTPEVVTEPTWRNYGSSFIDSEGNEVILNMEQPFFHTRTVATRLSIYNGATVVMGGMITEDRQTVDDKVPVLGDIPVIGRLFRSKYDRSEKRNLLIFVTARLVDPAGKPLSPADDTTILEQRLAEGPGD